MVDSNLNWSTDVVFDDFDAVRLNFPDDYDGAAYATLVRRSAPTDTKNAVLYIHGYMDYFFQRHLADEFNQHGYNFYALDLRKYGRSLGEHHHPNFCKSVHEYDAEITESLRIITEVDGNDWVVINGHSTGGLIASLYADKGAMRDKINAMMLNSPFFEWNFKGSAKMLVEGLKLISPIAPFVSFQPQNPVAYMQSIHQDYEGEWDFDLRWRPINNFPIFAGWCRAITDAHNELKQGLSITCPVLVMHSDKSIYGDTYSPKFQTGDGVLGVEHIKEASRHLGDKVTLFEVENGLHDLVLSEASVRQNVFDGMFNWLNDVHQSQVQTTVAGD